MMKMERDCTHTISNRIVKFVYSTEDEDVKIYSPGIDILRLSPDQFDQVCEEYFLIRQYENGRTR